MNAPAQVRRAVIVLWIALGLSALESLSAAQPLDPVEPRWDLIAGAISGAVLLVTGALVYLISRRHNWARITYLVLTVLTFAGYAAFAREMFTAQSSWSTALTGLIAVCDIVALYWLFTGAGARWYAAQAAA